MDPTRTKILREEFVKALKKLPESARQEIIEALSSGTEINEATIEEMKQILSKHLAGDKVEQILSHFTILFWNRGAEFANRQLKRYGITIEIPPHLSILENETLTHLKNMQLDLIKGLSEETKKALAFQLREGLIKGESIPKLTERVKNVINDTKWKAERIARTESMRVFNTAAEDRYKKAGVRKYRILEAIDERTCRTCMLYHNKIYRFDDPSAPRPPFHPNCRGTIVPVIVEDPEVRRSINQESREIAFDKATEIIGKIDPRKFVSDEENITRLATMLKQDVRFRELLGSKASDTAKKLAIETIETFKREFTHHAIIQALERGKKEGYNLIDVLKVKKRGRIIRDLKREIHKAGKSRGIYLYVIESKKDGRAITHWKITENKYRKLVKEG